MCCCGIENLEGFKENTFNINHIIHGEKPKYTENMTNKGTGKVFSSIYQDAANSKRLKNESFVGEMINIAKNKKVFLAEVFGKKGE